MQNGDYSVNDLADDKNGFGQNWFGIKIFIGAKISMFLAELLEDFVQWVFFVPGQVTDTRNEVLICI